MSRKPLISVIIPAYNHEMYVQQAIQSIIDQKFEDIELLVIDDGSTDSTFEKILAMQATCEKRFKRVVFSTQDNQGVCKTLNRLCSQVQSKYIFMIASDDLAKPSALNLLYETIKNDEYILVVGDNEIIDADAKPIAWDNERNSVPIGNGYHTFWSYLLRNRPQLKELKNFGSYESLVQGNYLTNGALISKTAYDKANCFISEAPVEDWYMALQLSKVGRFKFIDQVLFSYRWHGKNTILQREKMLKYASLTMKYERKLIGENNDSELIKFFDASTIKIKYLVRFRTAFILYKRRDIYHKQIIAEIFGRKIILLTYEDL